MLYTLDNCNPNHEWPTYKDKPSVNHIKISGVRGRSDIQRKVTFIRLSWHQPPLPTQRANSRLVAHTWSYAFMGSARPRGNVKCSALGGVTLRMLEWKLRIVDISFSSYSLICPKPATSPLCKWYRNYLKRGFQSAACFFKWFEMFTCTHLDSFGWRFTLKVNYGR